MAESQSKSKPSAVGALVRIIRWMWDRLERTVLLGLRFVFPQRFISPLGFLGMLTFVVFLILGVTGALLMFYYQPSFEGAYDTVEVINDKVVWGLMMRNIHYHASNAMILLAIAHMFYQYFAGRYKLRYEMLWVTGIILGVITIIEAYTGYDIIVNIRGMLAINIGRALAFNTPPQDVGIFLGTLIFGGTLSDTILRYYALHVFILPLVMLGLMLIHLPRNLVLDIPVATAVTGIIFIVGGFFPVELGTKFDPDAPTIITFPEWYFTAIYAFIRTSIPAFFAGAILPGIFVVVFTVVPFFDTGKKLALKDRPFWVGLGASAIAWSVLTTYWGFRSANPFDPLRDVEALEIDPFLFYSSMIMAAAISYGIVYSFVRWKDKRAKLLVEAGQKPPPPKRATPYPVSKREALSVFAGIILLQGMLNYSALEAFTKGLKNLVLVEAGLVLIAFAIGVHVYRVSMQQKQW